MVYMHRILCVAGTVAQCMYTSFTKFGSIIFCERYHFAIWEQNFDKQISSQERGGGVRGVEQWIRMATDYKIMYKA